MSESTTRHDHAAEPAGLNPFFREPQLAAGYNALAAAVAHPPTVEAPAGPEPGLEGTFAIYVTPDQALVVAYRPRGATADKQFVVPAFLINLATQRSGHSLADVVKGLKEQGE